MEAIEFKEVNLRIAEHQEEYQTLPVHVNPVSPGMSEATMCFELTPEEKKQVAETGCIWLTIMQPEDNHFHPIVSSVLKPDFIEEVSHDF